MMERILARALISAGLTVIAALLGLAAVGFFLTAVYLAVLPLGQPWLAPAITGGVALLVALALAVVATGRRERRPAPGSAAGREGRWLLPSGKTWGRTLSAGSKRIRSMRSLPRSRPASPLGSARGCARPCAACSATDRG